MKNIFLLTLISLSFLFVKGQSNLDFKNDPNFKESGAELIKLLDKEITTCYDFQIRFWVPGSGIMRRPTSYLLVFTFQMNHWRADSYTFRRSASYFDNTAKTEVEKNYLPFIDFDSLVNKLLIDSLLHIKSKNDVNEMDKLKKERGIPDYELVIMTEGGQTYIIELFTEGKRKKVLFNCPNIYYERYKLQELEKPLRIIKSIMTLMPPRQPC